MTLMIGFTGLRGVGKSLAADFLVRKFDFSKAHAFGPGKAMCVAYYEYLGIDKDTAHRMVHGDLKDTPNDKLPNRVASRHFMESLGKFMGVNMGPDWTLAVELDKLQREGVESITVESLVYEADTFTNKGGYIVRLERTGTRPTGEYTDVAQASVKENITISNNGSIEDLESKLSSLVRSLRNGLITRPGWEYKGFYGICANNISCWVDAVYNGHLSVHRMLSWESTADKTVYDEGFAISQGGLRISSGGRVYSTCEAAMDVADAMKSASLEWNKFFIAGRSFNPDAVSLMIQMTDKAEREGKILKGRVSPYGL